MRGTDVRIASTGLRLAITLSLVIMLQTVSQPGAVAQQPFSAKAQEEKLIRAELERIISEDPSQAAKARKILGAFIKSGSSRQGRQLRNRRERGARRIVNGLPAIGGHPAVGGLLKGNDPRTATAWCTGTLVGCDKFLTAAHCIVKDPSASSYLVFFQELGFFKVSRIDWPKEKFKFPYFDLAMLTLERPVVGIAPIGINLSTKPLNKSVGTIVGYGRTGGNRYDYGIKREGSILTQKCPSGMARNKLLCWRFDADVTALQSPSNTCNADSGGGIFMTDRDASGRLARKVFGVVSGGIDDDCVKDDLSYNVDVHQFRSWIKQVGEGRLSSRMCARRFWRTKAQRPETRTLEISATAASHTIQFDLPANLTSLHVALNGQDDGSRANDFDLFVYKGQATSAFSPLCQANGGGQFAFCEMKNPTPGAWTAVVRRKTGEGKVQVTITRVFGTK